MTTESLIYDVKLKDGQIENLKYMLEHERKLKNEIHSQLVESNMQLLKLKLLINNSINLDDLKETVSGD